MYSFLQISKRTKSITIIAISSTVFFVFNNINPSVSSFFPPCPFHKLTGLYCPGCGSLRALHQLLHGNISKSFNYNPLMILSLPFIIYSFLSYIIEEIIGKSLPKIFIPAFYIWILLVIILLFGILRNIRIYPFYLLAP
jgi:hypothetical protein